MGEGIIMRYLAVLFDFFGTLTAAVKRGPEHARVARSLGCEPPDWYALLNRTFYDRAVGALGTPYEVLSDLAHEAGSQPSDASIRRAVFDRISVTRADAPLRPDATATLRRLRRAGLQTAVVSDCWYELPALMPTLPIAGLLNATVYSCRLGRSKPHPDMYLAAGGCAYRRSAACTSATAAAVNSPAPTPSA
jgi:putative hydrolase of the HAD superfamily